MQRSIFHEDGMPSVLVPSIRDENALLNSTRHSAEAQRLVILQKRRTLKKEVRSLESKLEEQAKHLENMYVQLSQARNRLAACDKTPHVVWCGDGKEIFHEVPTSTEDIEARLMAPEAKAALQRNLIQRLS